MRKKRGREDESYNISEVMSKEEILSVVKKNKKNEDENSSSTNLCVEDLQKNKESNSIIKDRLSQTVRQNAKFFFDPVRKCNGQPVPFQQPKHFTGGVMRWYQVEGMEWLRMLWENGINGILADEMGLGKTVQCIATIALMIQRGVPGPFLVCGPLSTLPNWMAEFKRFTPDIPTMLYHGTQEERQKLVRNIHKRQGTLQIHPVVVTSFEIAMRDRNHCYWKYLIVDEGHRIKNMKCRLIRELKRFNADNKLLLTGTPLQNNLSELWSLLNFLLPDVFDDLKRWVSQIFNNDLTSEICALNLEVFIFLVSTRAGGLGINLTAADTVIIYDSDWSDLQAQDRCHRIGQTKPVVVYRLVTANTIDQKIVERAAAKRKLEKLIIHKNHFKGGQSGLNLSKNFLDPKELMELLKSRDYEREIKGSREKVISDKDLELLLDRSDLIDQMNASGPIKEKMGLFKILENSEDSSPECLF
uniref:Helicase, lymphoid specific n=1 Tax=Cebus imitator TaxID=2715852 RepID=A0A2K5QPQ5_CEBIM